MAYVSPGSTEDSTSYPVAWDAQNILVASNKNFAQGLPQDKARDDMAELLSSVVEQYRLAQGKSKHQKLPFYTEMFCDVVETACAAHNALEVRIAVCDPKQGHIVGYEDVNKSPFRETCWLDSDLDEEGRQVFKQVQLLLIGLSLNDGTAAIKLALYVCSFAEAMLKKAPAAVFDGPVTLTLLNVARMDEIPLLNIFHKMFNISETGLTAASSTLANGDDDCNAKLFTQLRQFAGYVASRLRFGWEVRQDFSANPHMDEIIIPENVQQFIWQSCASPTEATELASGLSKDEAAALAGEVAGEAVKASGGDATAAADAASAAVLAAGGSEEDAGRAAAKAAVDAVVAQGGTPDEAATGVSTAALAAGLSKDEAAALAGEATREEAVKASGGDATAAAGAASAAVLAAGAKIDAGRAAAKAVVDAVIAKGGTPDEAAAAASTAALAAGVLKDEAATLAGEATGEDAVKASGGDATAAADAASAAVLAAGGSEEDAGRAVAKADADAVVAQGGTPDEAAAAASTAALAAGLSKDEAAALAGEATREEAVKASGGDATAAAGAASAAVLAAKIDAGRAAAKAAVDAVIAKGGAGAGEATISGSAASEPWLHRPALSPLALGGPQSQTPAGDGVNNGRRRQATPIFNDENSAENYLACAALSAYTAAFVPMDDKEYLANATVTAREAHVAKYVMSRDDSVDGAAFVVSLNAARGAAERNDFKIVYDINAQGHITGLNSSSDSGWGKNHQVFLRYNSKLLAYGLPRQMWEKVDLCDKLLCRMPPVRFDVKQQICGELYPGFVPVNICGQMALSGMRVLADEVTALAQGDWDLRSTAADAAELSPGVTLGLSGGDQALSGHPTLGGIINGTDGRASYVAFQVGEDNAMVVRVSRAKPPKSRADNRGQVIIDSSHITVTNKEGKIAAAFGENVVAAFHEFLQSGFLGAVKIFLQENNEFSKGQEGYMRHFPRIRVSDRKGFIDNVWISKPATRRYEGQFGGNGHHGGVMTFRKLTDCDSDLQTNVARQLASKLENVAQAGARRDVNKEETKVASKKEEKPRVKCPDCPKTFASEGYLKKHRTDAIHKPQLCVSEDVAPSSEDGSGSSSDDDVVADEDDEGAGAADAPAEGAADASAEGVDAASDEGAYDASAEDEGAPAHVAKELDVAKEVELALAQAREEGRQAALRELRQEKEEEERLEKRKKKKRQEKKRQEKKREESDELEQAQLAKERKKKKKKTKKEAKRKHVESDEAEADEEVKPKKKKKKEKKEKEKKEEKKQKKQKENVIESTSSESDQESDDPQAAKQKRKKLPRSRGDAISEEDNSEQLKRMKLTVLAVAQASHAAGHATAEDDRARVDVLKEIARQADKNKQKTEDALLQVFNLV
jgi:hypothetical protein